MRKLDISSAYPRDKNKHKLNSMYGKQAPNAYYGGRYEEWPSNRLSKWEWAKIALAIAGLIALACIGLCGCGTDDSGLMPCEETNVKTNIDALGTNTDAANSKRWQTGYVPEECEAEVKKRDGYLYACPPAYTCWQAQGASRCMCLSGPTCARKADRQFDSRDCICTGMPGDWDGSKL